MKIGILTFHFGINYGGVLQCYALQETLKNMGYDVEIINYVPSDYNVGRFWQVGGLRKHPISSLCKALVKLRYSSSLISSFEEFKNKYLNLGQSVDESAIEQLSGFGAIIVGSDQVWGPSQRIKRIYFLDFKIPSSTLRISYAPCCAIDSIDENHKDHIANALKQFDFISARNKATFNLVKNLTGVQSPIVADPTLLHDFSSLINDEYTNEDYILTYIIGEPINGGHETAIKEIRRKYQSSKVYSIVLSTTHPHIFSWSDKTFYSISPIQWVNLFSSARFIYTDSYHGVLFSLKFKKPFLAYYSELMRASRFLDLKSRYALDGLIINGCDELIEKESLSIVPNYEIIDKLILNHQLESKKYLSEALSNE